MRPSRDRLAAGPAELLDHVRHGLRHDHVARRDGVGEAKSRGSRLSRCSRRAPPPPPGRGPSPSSGDRVGRQSHDGACARADARRQRSRCARSPSASRAGCTVADVRSIVAAEKAGDAQRLADLGRGRAAAPPRGRRRPAHAAIASSEPPSCASLVATYSVGAARYHASTRSASHHAPMPRTPRSDARTTSTARSSPTRSRRIGRSSHSVDTKPPFLPLGPCPASPASSTTTSERGLERLQLPGRPETEVAASRRSRRRRSCRPRAAPSARRAPPPRATSRTGYAAPRPSAREPRGPQGGRETSGYPGSARGGGSSAGRAPGCGPGGRGFESRPPPLSPIYPLAARPRSSADRAAGFEPACGGSTPPGAILQLLGMRRARSPTRDRRPEALVRKRPGWRARVCLATASGLGYVPGP